MQISFSLPESQFVTDSPEEATRKIRMFAAQGVVLRTQTPDELEEDVRLFGAEK